MSESLEDAAWKGVGLRLLGLTTPAPVSLLHSFLPTLLRASDCSEYETPRVPVLPATPFAEILSYSTSTHEALSLE